MTYLKFKENADPLKNIVPLGKVSKNYKAQQWWLYFQILIAIIGFGYSFSRLFIGLNEQNYFGIGFASLLIVAIIFNLALKIIRVRITKDEIEFTYFFNRKKVVSFRDISEIELRLQRGQGCILKSGRGKIVFQIFSIQEADQLIKTIIIRTNLLFIIGTNASALYKFE